MEKFLKSWNFSTKRGGKAPGQKTTETLGWARVKGLTDRRGGEDQRGNFGDGGRGAATAGTGGRRVAANGADSGEPSARGSRGARRPPPGGGQGQGGAPRQCTPPRVKAGWRRQSGAECPQV